MESAKDKKDRENGVVGARVFKKLLSVDDMSAPRAGTGTGTGTGGGGGGNNRSSSSSSSSSNTRSSSNSTSSRRGDVPKSSPRNIFSPKIPFSEDTADIDDVHNEGFPPPPTTPKIENDSAHIKKTPASIRIRTILDEEGRGRDRIRSEDWQDYRAEALDMAANALDRTLDGSFDEMGNDGDHGDVVSVALRRDATNNNLEDIEDVNVLGRMLRKADREFRKALAIQAYWFRRTYDIRSRLDELLPGPPSSRQRCCSSSSSSSSSLNVSPDRSSSATATKGKSSRCALASIRSFKTGENSTIPPRGRLWGQRHRVPSHVERTCIHIFNRSPSKGVAYAIESGLCGGDPSSVAHFLLLTNGLGKIQIGDYVSKKKDFNIRVADAFFRHGLGSSDEWTQAIVRFDLVGALEAFFGNFHPPGEAGPLERLINRFTAMYQDSAPDQFGNKDCIYVLTHAILMLNSSLHKKAAAKYRMSMRNFVKDVRASPDCAGIPADFLEKVYARVKEAPMQVIGTLRMAPTTMMRKESVDSVGDAANSVNIGSFLRVSPTMHGWATKNDKYRKTTQRRYFVLADRTLFYFKHEEDSHPHSAIPLHGCVVSINRRGKRGETTVSITHGTGAPILQVHKSVENRDEFSLCFSNSLDAKEWHDAISDEIELCDTSHFNVSPKSPRRPCSSDVHRSTLKKALSLSPQRRALSSPSLGVQRRRPWPSSGGGKNDHAGNHHDAERMPPARSSSKRRAFV